MNAAFSVNFVEFLQRRSLEPSDLGMAAWEISTAVTDMLLVETEPEPLLDALVRHYTINPELLEKFSKLIDDWETHVQYADTFAQWEAEFNV